MKKIYLSSLKERVMGLISSVIIIAAMAVLVFVLEGDLAVRILTALAVVCLSAVMLYSVINLQLAAVIPDAPNKKLHVKGIRSYTLDLSDAATLETISVKSGQVKGRSLLIRDGAGKAIGVIPTCFTTNQSIMAEPMAMELAKDLGLEFKANVPAWEYDKEAMKIHEAEVEQQEREEAKARKEAKKKLREAKIRKQMDDIRNEKK